MSEEKRAITLDFVFSEKERNQIYTDYFEKVNAYVRGKVSHSQEAEDVVSSVFLKVYQRLESFDPSRASLSTWIYTITRNTVIDYYRSRKIHVEFADYMESELDELIDESDTYETLLDLLADALLQLGERERDLIVLHYYKRMKLVGIADLMGMSYANAKVIHAKALSQLRALMKDHMS